MMSENRKVTQVKFIKQHNLGLLEVELNQALKEICLVGAVIKSINYHDMTYVDPGEPHSYPHHHPSAMIVYEI